MHRIGITGASLRTERVRARAPRPLAGTERVTAAAVAVVALVLTGASLREVGVHDLVFVGVTVVVFGLLALGARWVLRAAHTRQGLALSAGAALVATAYLNNDVLDAPPAVFRLAGWALVTALAMAISAGRRAA